MPGGPHVEPCRTTGTSPPARPWFAYRHEIVAGIREARREGWHDHELVEIAFACARRWGVRLPLEAAEHLVREALR